MTRTFYLPSLEPALIDFSRSALASFQVPEIIKHLIDASAKAIKFSRIPGDKGVYLSGLDGFVNIEGSLSRYLPEGNSKWEIKTSKDFSEVKNDYKKRTYGANQIPSVYRKQSTYVAIYFRYDTYDTKWVEKACASHEWLDFRIFTISEITTWILNTPTVLLDIVCPMLGLELPDIYCASQVARRFWFSLNIEDQHQLAKRFNESVFSGIYHWLSGVRRNPLCIISNSTDESVYFLHKALESYESEQLAGWVVESSTSWNKLADNIGVRTTILIPNFKSFNYSRVAHENGFSLIMPAEFSMLGDIEAEVVIVS